jgi:tmRNA-binding protein
VFIKIIIGIVKGKKEYNKKQSIKERDLSRNAQREISFR